MKNTITVALFIIGNLIGAGFFMMPASIAPLGCNLICSWTFGLVVALVFGLIFAKLFLIFPNSETLADYFQDFSLKQTVAILYWIGAIVGNAVLLTMVIAAVKISKFNHVLISGFLIMILLTFINHCLSYETVEFIEIILSITKFSLLIFLPMLIFLSNPSSVIIPNASGSFSEICRLGALSFWAFLGIETAGVFGNKSNSKGNGLLLGIVCCFVLYVFSCFLIVGSVPLDLLTSGKEIPLVYLIRFSKFAFLEKYVSILIAFTCFGALYGWVAATSKMSLSYAKNGLFHRIFLKETKSDNSVFGLWLSSFITFIILALVSGFKINQQFDMIADFCVNITLFIFCLCACSLYNVTSDLFDMVLSVFGFLFVGFLLMMNIKSSLISFILFLITFWFIKCLNICKKD